MANGRQASVRKMKMAERSRQQMELHFPNYAPAWLWHRKTNDGFTTIPRTLPIVMQAIDMESKGQPAGHTLLCLWARSPDFHLVTIENPATFAAEAGFVGERAVDTWRKRMRKLVELSAIDVKEGPSGSFHYVLLLNPNATLQWMQENGRVQDGVYARFVDRLTEVGAYGEIEALHEFWNSVAAQQAAAAAASAEPEAAAA